MKTVLRVIADELEATSRQLDQVGAGEEGDILADRLLTLRAIAEALPPTSPGDVAILMTLIVGGVEAAFEHLVESPNRASLKPAMHMAEAVRQYVEATEPARLEGYRKELNVAPRKPSAEPQRRAA
jgi:hypothetical protein